MKIDENSNTRNIYKLTILNFKFFKQLKGLRALSDLKNNC